MNNTLAELLHRFKETFLRNKSVTQTIAKNTFWLTVSEVIGRLLRVAVIIYAARILGAAGWGTFSYLASLAAVLTIFSDIGISSFVIREVSKNPEKRAEYFSTAFIIKIFLAITGIGIILLAPQFTAIPISATLIVFISLLFIFDSFRRFGTSLFRAEEKMEKEALVNIITQSIIVVGGFAALMLIGTPESLGAAYAVGAGAGLLITMWWLRADIKQLIRAFNKKLIMPMIKAAWPLSIAAAFSALLLNIDTVMIGWFHGAEEVGYYAAAQRPITLLYVLPTLVVGSFFPALSRFAKKNERAFREVLERGMFLILIAAFPIALGIALTANRLVTLLYGQEYILATGSLRILAFTVLVAFPASLLIHSIFAHNKQKALVPLWIAGTILNITLNLLLIPRLGISGAAWASLITQIIVNSLIWISMRRISFFSVKGKLAPILLATFMMGSATLVLQQLEMPLIVIILGAMFAYLGSLIWSGEKPIQQLTQGIKGINT